MKNIFQGDGSFFKWKKKDKKDNESQEQKKYLGFIPQEVGKNVLLVIGGLLGLFFIYWVIKKQFEK